MASSSSGERGGLWKHLVAGCGAGVTTTVILHPIELVKVRLQAQDHGPGGEKRGGGGRGASTSSSSSSSLPRYAGTKDAIRSIVRLEGWRGLYSGLAPSMTGSGVAWGLYFMAYNGFKSQFRGSETSPGAGLQSNQAQLSPLQNLVCALEAGALVTLLTNPIWVIKTRLQLQLGGGMAMSGSGGAAAGAPPVDRYTGMTSAAKSIWRKEGLAGFYRGIWPSMLLVAQGSLQLMAYEGLSTMSRDFMLGRSPSQQGTVDLSSLHIGAIGACSKLFATFFTYPAQVVRTRLQKRQDAGGHGKVKPPTMVATFRTMLHKEGFRGFYKGMVPNLMRTMPQSAITFAVYERILKLVRNVS